MNNQANIKKISGVLIAVLIAAVLFMTVPVNAATVTVDANPRSGGTTTITVTLQNAPNEILIQHYKAIYGNQGFMNLLDVTLKCPNGTTLILNPSDAVISATEDLGSDIDAYGTPLEEWMYGYGFGYGYSDWYGYGYTGHRVDVTLSWNLTLEDGRYIVISDMPSTLNNRGGSDTYSFRISGTTSTPSGSTGGMPLQGQNITIDLSSIQGSTDTLRVGDIVTFTINGETHTGILLSLNTHYAVIEFNSEPVRVTVSIGATQEVDLDADGTNDISVYLSSITNGNAVFTFSKIVPATPAAQPSPLTGKVTTEAETAAAQPAVTVTQQQAAPTNWATIAIAVVILGVGAGIAWFVMKKK